MPMVFDKALVCSVVGYLTKDLNMDWLRLGFVLLAIFGNIKAQQGYNYPKPKTPFPAAASTDTGAPRSFSPSGVSSTQSPFGSQQPSNGFSSSQPGTTSDIQRPLGSQQPSGGFPSGKEIDTQRPFGSQEPAGYPSVTQSGTSSNTQIPFRKPAQKTTGGQPGTSSVTERPFGSQQPFGETTGIKSPSGTQRFGGYPSAGQSSLPSGTPSGGQTPLGTQPSFGSLPQQGYSYPAPQKPFAGGQTQPGAPAASGATFGIDQQTTRPLASSVTQRPFGSQQPSGGTQLDKTNGIQRSFGTQALGGYPGEGKPVTASNTQTSSGVQGSIGYPNGKQPSISRPFGSQQPSQAQPGAPSSSQSPFGTQQPAGVVQPSTAFASQPSGGYPSQTQFSQQPSGGYPQNGVPNGAQRPFETQQPSAGYPGSPIQYPSTTPASSAGSQQGYKYSTPQRPLSETGPTLGGAGSVGSSYPSANGKQPAAQFPSTSSDIGQRISGGYPQVSATTGPSGVFPGAGSKLSEIQGKQGRGEYTREDSTRTQYPSVGATQPGFSGQGSFKPEGYPESDRPTRPQFSGGFTQTSEAPGRPDFPGTAGGTSRQQRPLSSYLPPGHPGIGNLPLSRTSATQFSSSGITPQDSISLSGGKVTGAGLGEQPSRSQNGYDAPGGQFPSRRPSNQPISSQNGYSSTGSGKVAALPSGSPFPTRVQTQPGQQTINGYSTPQLGRNGQSSPAVDVDRTVQGFSGRDGQIVDGPQTFPGSQQSSRGFIPSLSRPSNEESNFIGEDEGDYSAIPGEPGRDYPILSDVPETTFSCDAQEYRGYYADVETRCQIFHICANNKTYDFLCPNGTIFHQEHLVCVWWNQFDCDTAPSLYRINANIYDETIFGAQQTGGIPVAGQDFPLSRTTDGGIQTPGGREGTYPNGGSYPSQSGLQQGQGGFSSGAQEPGGSGYPSRVSQGTDSGFPSGQPPRPGSIRNGGYPSGKSQEPTIYPDGSRQGKESPLPQNGAQTSEGYRSQQPGSAGYPGRRPENVNTPYPGADSQFLGSPSGRPIGPSGSQVSTTGQGPIGGSINRPSFSVGSQTTDSVPQTDTSYPSGRRQYSGPSAGVGGNGRPERPGSQLPSGQRPDEYQSGALSKPGPQGTVPSGSGSPFPGSPQQPSREYLPSV